MKKLSIFLSMFAAATAIFAQSDPPNLSSVSRQYRLYRQAQTEPTYGLHKVKALIARIKPQGKDEEEVKRIPAGAYNSLSFPEKFTYTMIHAEAFSQNCNAMPGIVGEETKIFAYPPGAFDDMATWSDQQLAFLKNNRSKVIGLIRATIKQRNRVGINLKQAITQLDAYELIPDLIAEYNRTRKDQDILTVLMLLMKEGKFQPFLDSSTYKKLYGEGANYQAYIVANSANQKLMIQRATAYYRSRMG